MAFRVLLERSSCALLRQPPLGQAGSRWTRPFLGGFHSSAVVRSDAGPANGTPEPAATTELYPIPNHPPRRQHQVFDGFVVSDKVRLATRAIWTPRATHARSARAADEQIHRRRS